MSLRRTPRHSAPLPGTLRAPQALFVDRWGTLLELPERGFVSAPDELSFQPGATQALFRAGRAGWKIFLLGNEDAVAHGHVSLETWKAIQARISEELERAGVFVTRDYTCLEHPEGVASQRGDSVYLLPNTGAFYHASHEDGVDLSRSWVIGDSTLELVAGWRAGCRLAAVRTGVGLSDATFEVDPELVGADLGVVVEELLHRQAAAA